MPKLKVYRTPIGFHDAYVAAASQKAALQAWGSDADLFARGIAEVVTDEASTAEPLASPGKVIRKLRGTADEQLAAAKMPDRPKPHSRDDPDDEPATRKRASKKTIAITATAPPPPPHPPPPRPDRAKLDVAEKAIEDAQARHEQEDRDLRKRQEALDQERRSLDRAHDEEQDRLVDEEDRARRAYEKAMAVWKAKS